MKAGLTLPVARIKNRVKKGCYIKRCGDKAGVALTSAIQFIVQEVIDKSIVQMEATKGKRLMPIHINKAIHADKDLFALFDGTSIQDGHTLPYVKLQTGRRVRRNKSLDASKAEVEA
jgi:hypothetical protein